MKRLNKRNPFRAVYAKLIIDKALFLVDTIDGHVHIPSDISERMLTKVRKQVKIPNITIQEMCTLRYPDSSERATNEVERLVPILADIASKNKGRTEEDLVK